MRSFLTILGIIMLGMLISILYFSATQAEAVECKDSTALGSRGITSGTRCTDEDRRLLAIEGGFDAYAYLKTKLCPGKPEYYVTEMNPQFAKQLAVLIKKVEKPGYQVRILSGARRPSDQQRAINSCKARSSCRLGKDVASCPTCSNHTKGCAADLKVNGCSTNPQKGDPLHTNAASEGLYFRMSWEPWHIEPTNRSYCTRGDGTGGSVSTSYNPDTSKNSEAQSTQQQLNNLHNQLQHQQPNLGGLGGGSGGGGSPSSYSTALDEIYGTDIYTDDGAEFLDAETLGDGAPTFGGLLDGEIDVIGSDGGGSLSSQEANRDNGENTYTATPIASREECVDGQATQNIYGSLICVRKINEDGVVTSYESLGTTDGTFTTMFNGTGSGSNTITRTLGTLVQSINPIRHLGEVNKDQYVSQQGRTVQTYDAFVPGSGTAYGTPQQGSKVTYEDLVAWMIQNDLVEADADQATILATLLSILRPVVLHIMVLLFGTGSFATDALLNVVTSGGGQ